jgi:uncharacterized membrane protein YphA (DoxX/SURF4 family)
MKNVIRLFIAPWYLLGWLLHIAAALGLSDPQIYDTFGRTGLIPGFSTFWDNVIMPRIAALALLLAIFEVVVGILLISKGKWVKIGVVLSVLFNLFLVQLGLGFPAPDGMTDFLANRLPNLFFIALQVPLFWGDYTRTLPDVVAGWFKRSKV